MRATFADGKTTIKREKERDRNACLLARLASAPADTVLPPTPVAFGRGTARKRGETSDAASPFPRQLAAKAGRFVWNVLGSLKPWEARIKRIESQFGTVVASYFIFLRWLTWLNIVLAAVLLAFLILPEVLTAGRNSDPNRKTLLPSEQKSAFDLVTLWNFEGILRYSPIFYGFYSDVEETKEGYKLPFAYFMAGMAVYVYSFVAILRRMASNARMSKMSEKGEEAVFSWKLFTGWDFTIGHSEAAINKRSSLLLGFREALLEEQERLKATRGSVVFLCAGVGGGGLRSRVFGTARSVHPAPQQRYQIPANSFPGGTTAHGASHPG
ncbi:unnamed protein product [Darwinula stevensoni]|uniref:Uncharacterized protein n=1 Tax=Darwinula stevensoni TaxID=69355 RepID=A0A7R9A3K8_9CRUS|nr:unnamed protein product [Darwinula stevensoni]CAG0882364.1 unnamed protein product [Darwinula stevensoni]